MDASSPYYHEDDRTSIFYAESWALTHYLITRDGREHTHRLTDFVALLGQNMAQEEAARRTIGDLNALQEALGEYIGRSDLHGGAAGRSGQRSMRTSSRLRRSPRPNRSTVRADFMAHDHHYEEAREMLEEALKLDPALASAHEAWDFCAPSRADSMTPISGIPRRWRSIPKAI